MYIGVHEKWLIFGFVSICLLVSVIVFYDEFHEFFSSLAGDLLTGSVKCCEFRGNDFGCDVSKMDYNSETDELTVNIWNQGSGKVFAKYAYCTEEGPPIYYEVPDDAKKLSFSLESGRDATFTVQCHVANTTTQEQVSDELNITLEKSSEFRGTLYLWYSDVLLPRDIHETQAEIIWVE